MSSPAFRAAFRTIPERFREENFPLSTCTTYGTGGPARYAAWPISAIQAQWLWVTAAEESIPAIVLGYGSNVVVSDAGFGGLVILMEKMRRIRVEAERLTAEAGASLRSILQRCIKEKLTGLEFLAGIPGTLGGATVMNAGLKEQWLSSVLETVEIADHSGIRPLPASSLPFGYRTSGLDGAIVTGAAIHLREGDPVRTRREIHRIVAKRRKTQPLLERSAGSVFRNPPGDYAGRLIDACGLKGKRCGGAQVSLVHANFIVNTGGATSADIRTLAEAVRAEVQKRYTISLEYEVKFIGAF